MDNLVAWCDNPVLDLERAIRFYSQVSFAQTKKQEFPDASGAMLQHDGGGVGARSFMSKGRQTVAKGVMI